MTNRIKQFAKKLYQKGVVHIFAGSFMTKLVAFFGSVFLARVLTKAELGTLGYLENIYGYVLVLAGMGLSNAILRYVVLAESTEEKYAYFRYCTHKGIVWNIVLGATAGIIFWFYPHPEGYKEYVWLLFVMFAMLPFQYLTDNMLSTERAMFSNKRYAVFSFVLSFSIILSKILSGYFAGIKTVVFAQFIVYFLMALLMTISVRKGYFSDSSPCKIEKIKKREIDKYSLQYMVTNGLWTVFMLNDTFLLGRLSDPSVVADYKISYTIPGCVNLISTSIGIFIAPYFVQKENDYPWIRSNFKKTYAISAAAVGAICLAIGVLAKPIIWILYGEQYLNVVPVMRLLLLAAFFNCGLRYTSANLLAAMGQVKYNMRVSVAAIILQLAINIYAVPKYGATGVAVTSCIVYLFMAVVLLAVFVRKYFIKNKN